MLRYKWKITHYIIIAVWLINGLFCKVLNFVPRHQLIVAKILGENHAFFLTKTIGFLEIGMAIWIASRIKSKLCSATQIALVLTMNVLEAILAPELLLFGYLNFAFALAFAIFLFFDAFVWIKERER